MLTEFKSFIEKHHLIEKDDRILLALSGGVDSMVLAKLLILFKSQQSSSIANSLRQIAFAHCNFHLRGDDSDRDENFVRQFAKDNEIELFVKHFDTEAYAKDNSISIEMAARELRYSWFKELKMAHDFTKVALAHHGDDQIETFFINMLRGSGIKGLKGMKAQNDFYIRPLLFSNRNQIETFAKDNDIQWVEDYTNNETVYLRNKIRHNILPSLDTLKDNARQSINFSIDCLSSENDLYRKLIDEKLSQIETLRDDCRCVENRHFLHDESGRQLLFEYVRKYGFNYEQSESMFEAMSSCKSGAMFYSGNCCASIQTDTIEIFYIKDIDNQEFIVNNDTCEIENPFSMTLSLYEKNQDFKLMKSPSEVAQFDADKLVFPLKLRHWRKGDRFRPLGMKGSKLLSDFFNDLGFSAHQKQNVWLLTDSNDLIIWVVGYRINDKFKINNTTRHIFQCMLNK